MTSIGRYALLEGHRDAPSTAHNSCTPEIAQDGRRTLIDVSRVVMSTVISVVVQRWADLQTAVNRANISLTKPVDTNPFRAITGQHDLTERTARRIELRSRSRFVLRTDINRFYPSIYTHSLPWSVHSKAAVKAHLAAGTLGTLWSNQLDLFAQSLNDRQTMGIPIGPDCSLVMAEVLLSAVDEELTNRIPGIRGIRYIDDYEFGVNQHSEAEYIVSVLQSILSHYELALNPSKTRIITLPEVIEPLWTSRLRTFLFRDAGVVGQRNDLTAYFDMAFSLAKAEPDEGILKYAVPRLNTVDVFEDNWPLLAGLFGQCVSVEPACLPQVCEQIVHYQSVHFAMNAGLWRDVLNRIVSERLPLGQASEAVWALWLMKQLNISLSPEAETAVAQCEDSVAALMGLGMASVGLANAANLTQLNVFAEPAELGGRQWLLCYEGVRQGWITPTSGAGTLAADPQFAFLHANGVTFFDINAAPSAPRRFFTAGGGGGGGGGNYPE